MTIDRWIVENAKSAPDKIAIEYKGKALTYKDFAANIADTAADLRARGIGHGDRVAWYGMNEPQVFVLLFACARLGAMFVPLNWRLADDEIDHVWASAEPAAIFADEAFAEKVGFRLFEHSFVHECLVRLHSHRKTQHHAPSASP